MVRVQDMNLLSGIRDVGCFPGSVDGESETIDLWGHLPAHWRVDGEEYKNSGENEKYGKTSIPPFMEDYPCYVGGWGTTEEGSQSDVFKSVNIHIMSSQYCLTQSTMGQSYGQIWDSNAEFCAGVPEGGKDSCQ